MYPVDSQKTARVGYLAQEEGWCDLFTERVFELNFVHGKPIGAAGSLEEAISHVGKDPTEVFARAFTDRVEAGLQSQTERAEQLGMFGSPNFLVGDEMFWGDDRLEDAIDCALGG